MIGLGAILIQLCSGNAIWRDTVRLDTMFKVAAQDTLKIEANSRVIAVNHRAGIVVSGTLVVAGDGANRVGYSGGRGIAIEYGGTAYLSGMDLYGTNFGIELRGGEATLWDCRLATAKGRTLVDVQSGDLVMARTTLKGSSPLLTGTEGSMELDDVMLVSDTLWRIGPDVRLRFQDVEAATGVRLGQDPPLLRTHLAVAPDTSWHFRWAAAPSFGSRVSSGNPDRAVATIPVSFSATRGSLLGASLVTGWRSGWLGGGWVFDERDQTLLRLQLRPLPGLELGVEGGWGGDRISWDAQKAQLASGLLEIGMELDEPFVSPGPVAGGRLRYTYKHETSLSAEAGASFQWRGSSGSLDLGNLASGWALLSGEDQGRHLGILVDGVYCFPDKLAGIEGDPHWQWNIISSHRQNLSRMEYGGELGIEGRDDDVLAQRGEFDFLWGTGKLRCGPSLMEVVSRGTNDWNGAAGPGLRVRFRPSSDFGVDAISWARLHRDRSGRTWWGGDATVKITGGF